MDFDKIAETILEEMYSESAKGVIREKSFDLVFADRLREAWMAQQEPHYDEKLQASYVPIPSKLHPDSAELVATFAWQLAIKLRKAEQKYGYSNGWKDSGWMDECRAKLNEHVAKGDPIDVAAYCAFLMWHNERTAAPVAKPAAQDVPEGCTPADARMLRKANHALAIESHRRAGLLREWLETELDAQDEEFQPWINDFTARVTEETAPNAAQENGRDAVDSPRAVRDRPLAGAPDAVPAAAPDIERDAERYRWLRDNSCWTDDDSFEKEGIQEWIAPNIYKRVFGEAYNHETLDAAIDAAIEKEGKQR